MDSNQSDPTRRDFTRLSMAAFAGVVVGTTGITSADDKKAEEGGESLLLQEPHVCRGLNTCKGKGVTEDNACAGQGKCATAEKHSCKGENACKGQGGCGENPGENACKGKGDCAVPLQEKAWKNARANFEAAMKKAGKKFGKAPEAKAA